MSPEDQKFYEDRLDLFAHPGWKDLMKEVENDIKILEQAVWMEPNKDTILRFQGQMLPLRFWQALEQKTIDDVKAIMAQEEEAKKLEVVDDADL